MKKRELIIPMILGIAFSLLYFKIPTREFALVLVGFLGVVSVLYDIKIALTMGVFILPFMPDTLNILFMVFLVGVFFFNLIFKKDQKINKMPMDLSWALFVILILVSTFTSINPKGSFRDLAIHFSGIGFLVVLVNSIENKNQLNTVVTFLVFSGTLVALYGLFQFATGSLVVDKAWVDVKANPDMKARVYSVFGNPNILAEYLIMIIPMSVALFWHSKKMSKKFIFLMTSLIMSLALILTMSRGGWLGFAMSALIFIVLVEKRWLLSIVPISIGGIFLLPDSIMNRILSIGNLADSSNAYRFETWNTAIKVFLDNKWVGVGFGYIPFKQAFESYTRTLNASHAHNTYLEVLAETGIVGAIIFVTLFLVIFKYGYNKLIKSDDSYIKILAAGAMASIGALLTQGLVENVLYMTKITVTFWIIVSFIFTLSKLSDKETKLEEEKETI